jgi:hypothetical protein
MEELASLLKSIPTNEDVVGNEAIVKHEQSEQQEASTTYEDMIFTKIEALWEACQMFYQGAQSTKLIATMMLMNVCQVHGVSNKFVDELLSFFHKHLLPRDNFLPSNMYQTKTLISKVGPGYQNINACYNRCVLFLK